MSNYICLILVLLLAIKDDIREGKIKNYYTLPMLCVGIVLYVINEGLTFTSISTGLFGLFVTFVIVIGLFVFKFIGGGDGKLFLAISALMGFNFFIGVLSYSIVVGGVYQFVNKSNKKIFVSIKKFLKDFYFGMRTFSFSHFEMDKNTKITFAIVIAFGVVIEVLIPLNDVIEGLQGLIGK